MIEPLRAADVATLLREVLDGARPLRVSRSGRRWLEVAVGEVTVVAGDAELTFFADSACVDHLVRVVQQGEARGDFAGWLRADGVNPIDLLTDQERVELERLLQEAT